MCSLLALTCDNTQNVANQGSSLEPWCPKFLLGFHCIGTINWLSTWLISGQLIQVTQNHTLNHTAVFLAWPAPPKIIQCGQPSLRPSLTSTHSKQRHSCQVWHWFHSLPEAKGKGQISLTFLADALHYKAILKVIFINLFTLVDLKYYNITF